MYASAGCRWTMETTEKMEAIGEAKTTVKMKMRMKRKRPKPLATGARHACATNPQQSTLIIL